MKKLSTMLAVVAIVGTASAYAANPFSDVTPSDWAYQAVSSLAQEGIINGYPDGTFQGGKDITRFEVAQMVAKAIAHEDRANAEQRAVINQLAQEFGSELNTLGVKVAALEEKVGNVRFSGETTFTYVNDYSADYNNLLHPNVLLYPPGSKLTKYDDYLFKTKLTAAAKVGVNTLATATVAMESNFGNNEFPEVMLDRAYVTHFLGNTELNVGRTDLTVGKGLFYEGAFDGAKARADFGVADVEVAHGYLMEDELYVVFNNPLVTYAAVGARPLPNLYVQGYYFKQNKNAESDQNIKGVNFSYTRNNVALFGEYMRQTFELPVGTRKAKAWTLGLGYGAYDQSVAGTYGVKLQYVKNDKSMLQKSALPFMYMGQSTGYLATAEYALANNVGLKAQALFSNKGNASKDEKLGTSYKAELSYKF